MLREVTTGLRALQAGAKTDSLDVPAFSADALVGPLARTARAVATAAQTHARVFVVVDLDGLQQSQIDEIRDLCGDGVYAVFHDFAKAHDHAEWQTTLRGQSGEAHLGTVVTYGDKLAAQHRHAALAECAAALTDSNHSGVIFTKENYETWQGSNRGGFMQTGTPPVGRHATSGAC